MLRWMARRALSAAGDGPRGVGAVSVDDGLEPDHVLLRLAHLLVAPDRHRAAVHVDDPALRVARHLFGKEPVAGLVAIGLVAHHALREEAGERLLEADITAIPERAREEARIKQVQHRMLDAADILVDGHPVIDIRAPERLGGARRAETLEIPREIGRAHV